MNPTTIGLSPVWLRHEKTSVLSYASRLTTEKSIPEAVAANALPLRAWLEAASGADDRRDRFAALGRADSNRAGREPDDDPERLISEAETYYEFLKAG